MRWFYLILSLMLQQSVDCVDGAEPGYISRKAVESVLSYQQQGGPCGPPPSSMEQLAALQEQALGQAMAMRGYNSLGRASTAGPEQRVEHRVEHSLKRQDSTSSSNGLPSGPGRQDAVHRPDGINVPDHLNIPRRRDSGNWSGDRNSASSSSSTSMDNPYLYLVGKVRPHGGPHGVPRSPTSIKPGELSSSSSGGPCDPGYDSYSLSSTDSLPLQLGLRHNLQVRTTTTPRQRASAPAAGTDCASCCAVGSSHQRT